ncbi:hypothetical protein Tco_0754920, partial [Tanacetum coccineum]
FLMSLLDDERGSGRWAFLFVWSGYAAMRTLMRAVKVVSRRDFLKEGIMCLCVCLCGLTQSIERDRLIGIGVVLDNSFRSVLSDPGNWIIEI